jgi:hypothetical protein
MSSRADQDGELAIKSVRPPLATSSSSASASHTNLATAATNHYGNGIFIERIFANTVVRWDQLCAAILSTPGTQRPHARGPRFWRNGRVEFSFLVYTISKNAISPKFEGIWLEE